MCKHIYLLNILVHIWSVCVCVCVDIHTHTHTHTLIHRKFIEWYIYIYINTSLSDVTFTKSCVCVYTYICPMNIHALIIYVYTHTCTHTLTNINSSLLIFWWCSKLFCHCHQIAIVKQVLVCVFKILGYEWWYNFSGWYLTLLFLVLSSRA